MMSGGSRRILALGIVYLCVGVASARSQTAPPTTTRPAEVALATRRADPPPTTQPSLVDRIKQPTPWFKWGADFRLRWEYLDHISLNKHAADDVRSWQRGRPRVFAAVTPAPGIDLNARFVWESYHWCLPHAYEEWDWRDGQFDLLNAKIKIPDTPATFTVGRQELMLGDGWLVLDGTPLDGSRTLSFDAARLNLDLRPAQTTADVIHIQNWSDTDRWLPPINDRDQHMIEQDEIGGIFYVSNKSIQNTTIDGYFIYKDDEDVLANGDDGDIYTLGTRVSHDWTQHFNTRAEAAIQTGRRNRQDVRAFGLNSRGTYFFRDAFKNQIRLTYEYLSGDNPNSDTRNEAFDPLWGRWPQWSEMYIYTVAGETRPAEMTNHHRLAFGWQADPTNKLTLSTDYHLLFADQNTYRDRVGFSDHGSFRGQLLIGMLRYRFNRFLSGHVLAEYYWPGNYFEDPKESPVAFLRTELVFTF